MGLFYEIVSKTVYFVLKFTQSVIFVDSAGVVTSRACVRELLRNPLATCTEIDLGTRDSSCFG
jgi:hypothetical protein